MLLFVSLGPGGGGVLVVVARQQKPRLQVLSGVSCVSEQKKGMSSTVSTCSMFVWFLAQETDPCGRPMCSLIEISKKEPPLKETIVMMCLVVNWTHDL